MIRHSLQQVGKQTAQRKKAEMKGQSRIVDIPNMVALSKARLVFIQTTGSTDQVSIRSHVVAPLGT